MSLVTPLQRGDVDRVAASCRHPLKIAEGLAEDFAQTAIERDRKGGTAKRERDLLRQSGLLNLLIPERLGGGGADWPEIMHIIRIFAGVDGSMAHLFGFQHLLLATVDLFGTGEQRDLYFEQTVRNQWFWGNALNPRDVTTQVTVVDGRHVVNGRKNFCSGATDADQLVISAWDPLRSKLVVGVIAPDRAGLRIKQDWDNFGQRQTDSGTVEFSGVELREDEILKAPGPLGSVRASLRPCIAQLILANIYLGIAEGALSEARNYTLAQTRPWISSGVDSPSKDPYILTHYGDMFLELQAAKALTDRAAQTLQWAWECGDAITENHRGRCALDVAAAKAITTRASLDVCNRMFEVMGARATTGSARLDRFWRNVRTHTLHDPVDYKLRELGDWALNHQLPTPTFYS
ncbi:MAG: acyl-CoA dehydrogenase family protein [Verrucomicrobia bacterium]|nr:acyl-CoA dehydrogenase family protein [Verrucomicrobiota bacterium]